MQIKPYQTQDPGAGANGDRIPVPPAPATAAQPPSLLAAFGREVRKRKRLTLVWALVTALVTGVVVFQVARPVYRAEGKFAYLPNYRAGRANPIYTPPNIQSAVLILKAPEVLEPVRERHLPGVSKEEFARDVRIEVARQSEFIDVTYDHPDPKVAAAVANDVMDEGLKHFTAERARATADGASQLRKDRDKAMRKLQDAKDEYTKTHLDQGVAEPLTELTNIQIGLADVNRRLQEERGKESRLKRQLEILTARRDAPSDETDAAMYDTILSNLQAWLAKVQSEANIQQQINDAKYGLEEADKKEAQYRPLKNKNILPQAEYDAVVTQIKKYRATLAEAERTKVERETIQKQYDALKKQMESGRPVRKAVVDQMVLVKMELESIPPTIAALEDELKHKQDGLSRMSRLQRELGAKDEDIKILRLRVQDFDTQLTDATERGLDLHANDLRIHSVPAAGTTPYSTNAPKLAVAVVGASAFLFVGYIALFGLPRLVPDTAAGLTGAAGSPLPRALVALVPFMQRNGPAAAVNDLVPAGAGADAGVAATDAGATSPGPAAPGRVEAWGKPVAGAATAAAEPAPVAPKALAERMAEDGVDHGGIVLFTPTAEQLNVAPAIGEMGQFFTQRGERVLVFDARTAAETPSWAGPDARAVAAKVESYLDGRPGAPTECFVPTQLDGVEYSRGDLATRVGGVMAAHRFRQLIEQMRERYSVVFLVGPPVTAPDGDPVLATLAEGMVLVTESSATPSEVHAFVESLSHQVPTRLYGTLSVPKA